MMVGLFLVESLWNQRLPFSSSFLCFHCLIDEKD